MSMKLKEGSMKQLPLEGSNKQDLKPRHVTFTLHQTKWDSVSIEVVKKNLNCSVVKCSIF